MVTSSNCDGTDTQNHRHSEPQTRRATDTQRYRHAAVQTLSGTNAQQYRRSAIQTLLLSYIGWPAVDHEIQLNLAPSQQVRIMYTGGLSGPYQPRIKNGR